MGSEFASKIVPLDIEQSMRQSFISYAMSVIVSRALPDVRDGLKPVQRRVLYAMYESNNNHDRPYRKSVKTVGEVLGNYHPHGDTSVYDTMVRLAQNFNLRYPLVDGQGNYGSIDGDMPAAMRYTEARLSKIAAEMLTDIEKDTVDFSDNFDNSAKEPTVLPSRFPNLLANGSTGIAVGMATNIPPHNLTELIDGIVRMIDAKLEQKEDVSLEELMQIIKGPDFPTGALILGREGIRKAFTTGKGSVIMRAKAQIETMANGKSRIVVTELPYMVNKAKLIERIAELVRDRKIEGITGLNDESDRTGIRVVVELRRDVNANVMLNQLYKHTTLQQSFGINMLALVNGKPRMLTLRDALQEYLKFQKEVIVRRTTFDLLKAEARAHIIEGLLKALDIIDEIINTIRTSPNTEAAKERLMNEYGFTDVQAQHILDLQLRRLTALERNKLQEEYDDLVKQIEYFRAILASDDLQYKVIKQEILEIKKKFGDERRTRIVADEGEMTDEDLIADEDVIITMTHTGYIKRTVNSTYRQQKRGGRGVQGMGTKDDDFLEHLFTTTTHTRIFFFTDRGRCFQLKAYEIPEASRTAKGTAIVNLIQIDPGEKINAVIPLKDASMEESFLLFGTKYGQVKKTALSDYANVRSSGLIAIDLQDDDTLVDVKLTDGNREVILVSSIGNALRFHEEGVRPMGRATRGVKGINLAEDDVVVGMDLVVPGDDLLVLTSHGIGKRTPLDEYPTYNRGARGVTTINLKPKHGRLVAVKTVREGNDLIIISQNGVLIRISVHDVRQIGRNTQGVQVMNMGDDDAVVAVAQVTAKEDEDEE